MGVKVLFQEMVDWAEVVETLQKETCRLTSTYILPELILFSQKGNAFGDLNVIWFSTKNVFHAYVKLLLKK